MGVVLVRSCPVGGYPVGSYLVEGGGGGVSGYTVKTGIKKQRIKNC